MRSRHPLLIGVLTTLLLVSGCGQAVHAARVIGPEAQLAAVKAANQRYEYAANAIVDGYHPSGRCTQDARGAMGQHYVNMRYFGRTDPLRPPQLFYVPVDGTMRLAGVEYYADTIQVAAAPVLFGRTFDGPMPGHSPGSPDHYDLHVWLYIDNPAGMFAAGNPALSCA